VAKEPAEVFKSGVEDLWSKLDRIEARADAAVVARVAALRKEIIDALLHSPVYQAEPGGPEVISPSYLASYLKYVNDYLGRWVGEVVASSDLGAAADLASHGYGELLGHRGLQGLTSDLVAAALQYRIAGFNSLGAEVAKTVAEEVQRVIFGVQSRWDAVRAIRSALDTGHDGLGKLTHRAVTLERTALVSIFNASAAKTISDSEASVPGVMKEWSAANQPSTCPKCKSLDGKRVKPRARFMGGLFSPPAHPRCRCRVVAWVEGW